MPPDTAARTDDQAFVALLQQATPRLRAFVAKLAGEGLDADDVLQEALAKIWRLRHTFDADRLRDPEDARSWLQRAVFRTFCDHWRRQRRQPAASDELHLRSAPSAPCPLELRDELRHRLAALNETERELLLGFHRDGLDLRELARRHAMPLNTVKSHLHRARARLAQNRGDES